MSLKLSQIRAAIATQVETVSGFHLINVLPDYFGRARESIAHKGFPVTIEATRNKS